MNFIHKPVMLEEVIKYFAPRKNQNYIDLTFGLGGHSKEILRKTGPNGKILAVDQDEKAQSEACETLKKYKNRIIYICDNFRNLDKIVGNTHFQRVSGILMDLGLGSWQIDILEKGISFSKNAPLDMRLGNNQRISAKDILNDYNEKQLANLLYNYGDVYKSRKFARNIINYRQKNEISFVSELIEAIGTKNPKILAPIFQAIRIEVNNEIENLNIALPQILNILMPKGKIIVISYHSGEDRIVKNFFRSNKDKLKILTKKPITPTNEEIKYNPRSRSAKLRVAQKG